MAIAGELINVLGFKLEGKENLKLFNQGMDNATAAAERNASRIRQLGMVAGLATTAMIGLGVSGFKNFAEFERKMNRIGITAGASIAETVKAGRTVQDLARQMALPLDQAVAGLDTLTSSGQSLEQALQFLPSVLLTAQASGAAVEDIANTALKTSSALKIGANDMQNAMDIMVVGGKLGQFELKDMASQIPTLVNQFANLGYTGTDGLKKLIAILQVVRETTGTAGEAATNTGNVFQKMFSQQTEKAFKKFGVNLRDEMEKNKAAGKDVMDSYLEITERVLKANPHAKLSDLFTDLQMQMGVLAMLTGRANGHMKEFYDGVNNADVSGTSMKDAQRIIGDSTAAVQKLSNSWDMFMKSVGQAVAPGAVAVLDNLTGNLSENDAMNSALEKKGYGFWARRGWELTHGGGEQHAMAREGGFAPTAADQDVQKNAPDAYRVLGRYPRRPNSTVARTGGDHVAEAYKAELGSIIPSLAAINENLANMTQGAAAGATITDARQDNRQFPVSVSAPVTVNVQQPTTAPAAVGAAVSGAIGKAATDSASRIEKDPAF